MSRIARNSVNGRLNRNTFCSGAEVAPVQCKRSLKLLYRYIGKNTEYYTHNKWGITIRGGSNKFLKLIIGGLNISGGWVKHVSI